jgi:hypothetical protein
MRAPVVLTTLYVVGVVVFSTSLDWQNLSPNELGGFLSGIAAPPAFFWFVITAFMQRAELQVTREQFSRQATALEAQVNLLKKTSQFEESEFSHGQVAKAIETIPKRIGKILDQVVDLKITRNGNTGEELDSNTIELYSAYFGYELPEVTPQATKNFVGQLVEKLERWRKYSADLHGPISMATLASNDDHRAALKDEWRELLEWYLETYQLAQSIHDYTFEQACAETGLEDMRKAYYLFFGAPELDILN